ncbi:hypothetical protein QBC37DRAFT_479687 [Rhypophila decipiens]|uniref:Uncharacterized protein n=1 Tax=Rhypophila decipiens TaxID=261697 RepID=A0AAN6YG75_9PEZI|nr:hypothetical protein QBC37DRAFT_479687 [Rhypophila decipiens]
MLLHQKQHLALGPFLLHVLLLTSKASASAIKRQASSSSNDDEPTPTSWTPIASMALPWPYQSPSLAVADNNNNNNNNNKTAVLGLLYSNPCGGATEFASTTTVNLPVDCAGATALSVTYRFGRCPLGRTDGPPATVDSVSATPRTSFGYTCLPTPAPPSSSGGNSGVVNVADITNSLPLPTLTAGQNPALTPAALEAVHHAGGECRVNLRLEPTDDALSDRTGWTAAECSSRARDPVTYLTTVTKTIEVGCDRCKYIRGGVVTASCPRGTTTTSSTRTAGSTTVWAYDCV